MKETEKPAKKQKKKTTKKKAVKKPAKKAAPESKKGKLVGKCQLPGWEEKEEEKKGAGRPTDYRPEYCDTVIELGREGKSKAQIAANLDVSRDTIDEWCKVHPEFSDAIKRARELSLSWWEDQGQQGIWAGKLFNANAYGLQVRNRFPEEYKEKVIQEQTGPDGGPQQHEVVSASASDEEEFKKFRQLFQKG